MAIRVIIFDDNQNLRASLFHMIDGTSGYECAGTFENCDHLLKNIKDTKPDVVLMDIGMPGINGIEAVKMIREIYPNLKILMQTVFEDHDKIFESILSGASGYILKNTAPSRILDFIKETYDGGAPMSPSVATKVLSMVGKTPDFPKKEVFNLTERENDVLACLVKGMSYKLIADTCQISIDTVRTHIRNIYDKLHVNSKGEAIFKAMKDNII